MSWVEGMQSLHFEFERTKIRLLSLYISEGHLGPFIFYFLFSFPVISEFVCISSDNNKKK